MPCTKVLRCPTNASAVESFIAILDSCFNRKNAGHSSIGRFDVSYGVQSNCVKVRGLIQVDILQPAASQCFQEQFACFRRTHCTLHHGILCIKWRCKAATSFSTVFAIKGVLGIMDEHSR